MTGGGFSPNSRSRFPILNKLSDFANVFKAFIGCNYLSLPFAFKQSGMILGIIGLLIVATITDHCCLLIVKCKQAAINKIMNSTSYAAYDEDSDEYKYQKKKRLDRRRALELSMTYGDLGRYSVGNWGSYIVNTALIITQFSFCVNYFIFMGDTITRMFPKLNDTLEANATDSSDLLKSAKANREAAPNVIFLMLIPFPFFMLQTYVRKVRSLGPLSAIANACVFLGFFSILGFILHGLNLGNVHKVELWRFSTFPIFFGQLVGAYEGIGTIIPIEASMNENRPNFPRYLHGAILCVSIILGSFGIFGYLHFVDDVKQLISDNLPYGTLSIIVQVTLCIGILFTYPLQMFPVIEISENFLFKASKERNTLVTSFNSEYSHLHTNTSDVHYGGADEMDEEEESSRDECCHKDREEEEELASLTHGSRVLFKNPGCPCDMGWSTWKRNILRTFLVGLSFGVAYVGRDYYAYISALSGSIGSSLLAFILPCIFHLILKKDNIPGYIVAKDILLILFGIIAGLVGFVTTLTRMIEP